MGSFAGIISNMGSLWQGLKPDWPSDGVLGQTEQNCKPRTWNHFKRLSRLNEWNQYVGALAAICLVPLIFFGLINEETLERSQHTCYVRVWSVVGRCKRKHHRIRTSYCSTDFNDILGTCRCWNLVRKNQYQRRNRMPRYSLFPIQVGMLVL